ncbi:S8 family peptidase [Corynebacterium casei]|uniref:S8 family peptidase n=1 Tax=Corynebacterium casei TaxID=160386 RepID=UPI003BB77A82
MGNRELPHIFVPFKPKSEPFSGIGGGGRDEGRSPVANPNEHGKRLTRELKDALEYSSPNNNIECEGTYITFESFPGLELALNNLDSRAKGERPELVAVRKVTSAEGDIFEATVYIPDGKKEYFVKKLNEYVVSSTRARPKNANLVEGIKRISRATIRELWTDPDGEFPDADNVSHWWELWLRKRDGREAERLESFAERNGLKTSANYLGFGDRTVVLLRASVDQLTNTFESLDDLAELRRPHEIPSLLSDLAPYEQREWLDELRERITYAGNDTPAVCILDRGVDSSHPLLSQALELESLHTVSHEWKHNPVLGSHGTEMAGLALFGNLQELFINNYPVNLKHQLESVKLLPDNGEHDPDVYGAVTARAVDQPEIANIERKRVFMMAVTAQQSSNSSRLTRREESNIAGRPTGWSAAIDALAYGRAIDDNKPQFTYLDRDEKRNPRLFVVSAGNIRFLGPDNSDIDLSEDHLERSDAAAVEDPAQAWNAITVGAYSESDNMDGAPKEFNGYTPIAERGELSPSSRTSVSFEKRLWPFKPEVVAAGGNLALSPDGTSIDTPPNLGILTTRLSTHGQGFLTETRDTSAATAQVASIAAGIYAAYPNMKPETVRALIVHSAEWTDTMRSNFEGSRLTKTELAEKLRRYGMGVPSLERAIHSATNALTLVTESVIHPFEKAVGKTEPTIREMNLHELPWPIEQLYALSGTQVTMRVTLSYFTEPNPSRRGWKGRYAYPSHGLRFSTKRGDENIEDFRKRINRRARQEGEEVPQKTTEEGWLLGSDQQKAAGSLHTDIWTGDAAALANKGAIVIYPVGGWWKFNKGGDQSDKGVDYSLVVSIESPETEVDLWTPVNTLIQAPVEISAAF